MNPSDPGPSPPPRRWQKQEQSTNNDDLPSSSSDRDPRSNAATAATAAGARAFTAQAVAFYFRAPVKAFFRTRVDYMAYARTTLQSLSPPDLSTPAPPKPTTWWQRAHALASQRTTPGILAHAVRRHGWRVLPDQVLPPLLANATVGAVLYTAYLQLLGRLHPDSARATRRAYPPPGPGATFTAGLLAGALQSVVAAPLDAIQARFERGAGAGIVTTNQAGVNDPKGKQQQRPPSMWSFSYAKLREIGARGIFAGWGLSLAKDSLGSAVFFSSFEYVKAQGFYAFVAWYYGDLSEDVVNILSRLRPTTAASSSSSSSSTARAGEQDLELGYFGNDSYYQKGNNNNNNSSSSKTIRPHYAIEPAFLMLAGVGASVAQQVVLHPLTHLQVEHWARLEGLDAQARRLRQQQQAAPPHLPRPKEARWGMVRAYYRAYRETWAQCRAQAAAANANASMPRWLYRGFWWGTLRQVPSTSAGLVIFELVRRKYGLGGESVRINKDGYDILLT